MYADMDLDQRNIIIKTADLEDAIILDENYRILICNVPNNDEKDKIKALRVSVQKRIQELKGSNDYT